MRHFKSVSPDQAIVEYTNATNECKQRLDLLELLKENNDKGELYADIINKRYLKNWTAAKTILYINDNYQLFLSERTFQRYERKALQGALDLL